MEMVSQQCPFSLPNSQTRTLRAARTLAQPVRSASSRAITRSPRWVKCLPRRCNASRVRCGCVNGQSLHLAPSDTPEGTVVTASGTFATVRVEASLACARCAAGRGCGAGLLQKGRTRTFEARVPADLHLEPGDIVRLELKPDHLLQAASLAYGLPLLGIMLGVGAASGLADADNEPLA